MAKPWNPQWRLFAVLLLLLSAAADAATITVDTFNQVDAGKCTITTAIVSMNAGADQTGCTHSGTYGTDDTIVLSAGTYVLTMADNGTNAFPFTNTQITINGNGATLSRTAGDVAPFFRFFEQSSGGLTINDVTFTGGRVPSANGGAINADDGTLVVNRCTFSGNSVTSGDGGAIHNTGANGTKVTASTFTNNSAVAGDGGAIYDGSGDGATLADSTFSGNSTDDGDGGAFYENSFSGTTITNCTFANNHANTGGGGAIYDNSSAGLTFTGGSVTGNSTTNGDGGGLFDNSNGGVKITNVLFTGNTAQDGGAIYDNSGIGAGPVSNNCIFGNTATSGSGILRNGVEMLNAINNWWGAASGPSGSGPGTGDGVNALVTFAPFLTAPAAACSQIPTTTTTTTTTTTVTTTTLPRTGGETCGDCVDNDGNGLTDFEDPACCASTLSLKIRKAQLVPRKGGGTLLGLDTTILQGVTANLNPLSEDVFLQIREQGGKELLCARIPASKFISRHGKVFQFLDRKLTQKMAEGVTGMGLRRARNDVILHAEGKKANVGTPVGTTLVVTVGFRGANGNQCAGAVKSFRKSGKKGALRAP